jgi:hypothetical protein
LDFDEDIFIEFVQPVLEAGDSCEVWGPHIGEVRAWVVALDESELAKWISRASGSLGAERHVVEIMERERHGAFAEFKIPLHVKIQGTAIDRLV